MGVGDSSIMLCPCFWLSFSIKESMEVAIIFVLRSSILWVISSNLWSRSLLFFETTVSVEAGASKLTRFSDFKRKISCFSRLISSLYCSRLVERDYSFTSAFTFTIFALLAKFKVDRVSWKHRIDVEMVATMNVLEFPPKLSLRRQVSFESR